jgi:hypothetical protein
MRTRLPIFLVSSLLLAGCASPSPTGSESQQSGIVGTWRRVSSDGKQVTSPHYTRYYTDGACAWWPALEVNFSTNGVTHCRYRLEGEVMDTDPDPDPNRPVFHRFKQVKIRGDKMTTVGEESDQDVYQRVVPDLEPGQ